MRITSLVSLAIALAATAIPLSKVRDDGDVSGPAQAASSLHDRSIHLLQSDIAGVSQVHDETKPVVDDSVPGANAVANGATFQRLGTTLKASGAGRTVGGLASAAGAVAGAAGEAVRALRLASRINRVDATPKPPNVEGATSGATNAGGKHTETADAAAAQIVGFVKLKLDSRQPPSFPDSAAVKGTGTTPAALG